MIPTLFYPTTIDFSTDGLGTLKDAVSCEVTEERNGMYVLEMQYPINGAHFDELKTDCIIKAKPSDIGDAQPFRISAISSPMKGIVSVVAEHVSYELNCNPIKSFKASGNAYTALLALLNAATLPSKSKYRVSSDISTSNGTEIVVPSSVRSCMGGQRGSVLDVWGGEYEWDVWNVNLHARRGRDTDTIIEYGKNLTDLVQEKSIADMYTAIMPCAKNG